MKLLIINTVPTERNGITNVIFNLLTAMDKNDVVADLLCINQPDQRYSDIVEGFGGKVIILERRVKKAFSYMKKLKKIIYNNKYDIIHVHGNSSSMLMEVFAAKRAKVQCVATHAHSTESNHSMLHKLLRGIFRKFSDAHFACGKDAGRWLYGNEDFTVINNGIDISRFAFNPEKREEIRRNLNIEHKIAIGHVGNFIDGKNQGFLVEILKELCLRDDRYCLLLIGDGPLKNLVKDKAASLGLENDVFFTGVIDNVPDYLSAIDCIVMPSLFEGLPLSLVEQQCNGLSCLVSDVVTQEVDLTGNVQFLSLNQKASIWAENIIGILEGNGAEDMRIQKSNMAVKHIRENGYDIQEEASKLKKLYSTYLQTNKNN